MHVRTPSVYAYVLVIIDTRTTFPYLTPAEFYRFHFILLAQKQKIIHNQGNQVKFTAGSILAKKSTFLKKALILKKGSQKFHHPLINHFSKFFVSK